MNSIWTLSNKLPNFETLCCDYKTDVLIIGGGICGILCGYILQSKGVDCAIIEADRKLCRNIDCDFKDCDSFVYSLDSRKNIENELNALTKIGCPAIYVDKPGLPFRTKGAVCIRNQAQFNPLKFICSIAENLKIFENTRALEIKSGEVVTDKGLSFREYNGLLLLGGGSHRTGKNGGGPQVLSDFAKMHFPEAIEVCS